LDSFDINRILEYLPHRYPFLLVDRIIEYDSENSLVARKNVTINEPYFQGHFPHRPVMPGVLIIEAMAQACAILASLSVDARVSAKRIYYFLGVDKARFKRPVEPGDCLEIHVATLRKIKGVWRCEGKAYVDEKLCSSAELMFTHKDLE